MTVGIMVVIIGWTAGNIFDAGVVGAVLGAFCMTIIVIDDMRRFDRLKVRRIAELQESVTNALNTLSKWAGRADCFTIEEERTGEPATN